MVNGTALPADAVVTTLTAAAREVTTTAPIGDATFAVGATIDVEFPDGTIQPGTVVSVGNVATNTANVPGATPSVTITIHVDDIPSSVDSFVQTPVTLRVVAESVPGAFVVPVSALAALAEGGFALQAVDGTVDGAGTSDGTKTVDASTPTHLIGVTPGLFTDGFVAVTGSDLAAGLEIVVPSTVAVDDTYDSHTKAMVKRWQTGLGVEATGTVALGSVVFLPTNTTVGSVTAAVGDTVGDGDTVVTLSAATQDVLIDVPDGDEAFIVPGLAVAIGSGNKVGLRGDGIAEGTLVLVPA